jgi:biotin carboxyl carrier protein
LTARSRIPRTITQFSENFDFRARRPPIEELENPVSLRARCAENRRVRFRLMPIASVDRCRESPGVMVLVAKDDFMDETMIAQIRAGLPRGYRIHPQFGIVYDVAPAMAVDLTTIQGINTSKAVALNQLGIYTHSQIAMWTHREVTAIADELQMSSALVVEGRWVERAQSLCRRATDANAVSQLPASMIRTVSLLACALCCGFLAVHFLANRGADPMTGLLSAEITTLRVPASSRLLTKHVKPGDEVFSGEVLLTLEKLAHFETIEQQQFRVRDLKERLQHAEAQATLEIDLQTSEIERQLFDLRAQTRIAQERLLRGGDDENLVVATTGGRSPIYAMTVSSGRSSTGTPIEPGGLLFFSGQSGQSTPINSATRQPGIPAQVTSAHTASAGTVNGSPLENSNTGAGGTSEAAETRLRGLEDLRELIPNRIRMAANLEQMQLRLDEETKRLLEMQGASREISVVSPAYGIVGQIRCHEGDSLQTGDVLLKILHVERRFVVVYVPTNQITDLQPGALVQLKFPGHSEYRGVVTEIPPMTEFATPGKPTMAAVRVEESDKMWPHLPIGSQVDVTLR